MNKNKENDDDYVDITNLEANHINKHYNEEVEHEKILEKKGIVGHQFQAEKMKSYGRLVPVAKFLDNIPSIMINQFELKEKITCMIVSCLHDFKDLIDEKNKNNGKITMTKIIINYSYNDKINPLCYLSYSFVAHDVSDYLNHLHHINSNNNEDYNNLNGYFLLEICYENKIRKLKKYNDHIGNEDMIEELIKHLSHINVKSVIDKLVDNFN